MNQSNNYFGQHLFSQLISLCNKSILSPVIAKCKANHYYKHLKTYEHFVAMLYCVVTGSTSLREIEAGLGIAQGKMNHLGIDYVPPRSTLSDGNKNRPAGVFKSIYEALYALYKPNFSDSTLSKPILDKLFLMDATVFGLFKAILKTNGRHSDNGKKKGGIKKNTVLHGTSLMPHFIDFSAAADNDQNIYSKLQLPQGSYLVFDKGYNNYKQYAKLTEQGVFFVTRQKENAVYDIAIECLHDNSTSSNILQETIITQTYKDELNNPQTLKLRRIAWYDEKQNRSYEFITNNFELDAETIALLYKYRWKIELFFKKLKQNFPLQYFVGDNQNAIEIQIWMALIALLLLSVIHQNNKTKMAFSVFVTIFKLHLFNYISIKQLLTEYKKKKPAKTNQTTMFNSS
ncbi:MAG: IS4 family transposase [Chitinophagales bacterium]|nr:IS4 family transposase [Chitinophagales bacterium]MCZ2223331.1 IS4 family transposase [Chitinophagales bacterium]MCZ2223611.1 IS4 family transposase [Chitinophagales bacterium]MCZ2223648.1 IS4 family transposase [Chitinophagales bacterium]MCZ2223693.1 IS4 family transposase [Chitinophagales bacterium]